METERRARYSIYSILKQLDHKQNLSQPQVKLILLRVISWKTGFKLLVCTRWVSAIKMTANRARNQPDLIVYCPADFLTIWYCNIVLRKKHA